MITYHFLNIIYHYFQAFKNIDFQLLGLCENAFVFIKFTELCENVYYLTEKKLQKNQLLKNTEKLRCRFSCLCFYFEDLGRSVKIDYIDTIF